MTTAEKNAAISRKILEKLAAGASIREAFDSVLGAGQFDAMAGEVYDALRNNA